MKYTKNDFIEFGRHLINSVHDGSVSTKSLGELFDEWANNYFTSKTAKDNFNFLVWINKWYKMFPQIKNGGNKKIQSNLDTCINKMKVFIDKYKYSYEEIDRATDMYLRDMEKDGFQYCRTAYYFIDKKGAGSSLLEYCEKLKNNYEHNYQEEDTSQYFI
ncbi:hypothetical protein [Leptolyngbya phage Lbo-JY46]